MYSRLTLKIYLIGLRIGIIISLFFSCVAYILSKSIITTLLGVIVSIFLWKLGSVVTDIIIDGNYVEFVMLNKKRIKLTIYEVAKIDNYKNYTFAIKTKDGKTLVGTDSVTTKLLVWINGESHARINEKDFPKAEYILH